MKRILLAIVLGCWALCASAASSELKQLLQDIVDIGGQITPLEEGDKYIRLALTDSTTLEVYECAPDECDKVFMVMTVCAPQCSSCARVYNLLGEFLFEMEPAVQSIFPLATMDKETGRITWYDNDDWEYQGNQLAE